MGEHGDLSTSESLRYDDLHDLWEGDDFGSFFVVKDEHGTNRKAAKQDNDREQGAYTSRQPSRARGVRPVQVRGVDALPDRLRERLLRHSLYLLLRHSIDSLLHHGNGL
jgi:hypothetical protein